MAPQQQALLLPGKQAKFEIGSVDVPKAGAGDLVVKVHATALNPIDWKIQKYGIFIENFPAVLGEDSAGTVEEVGDGVSGFRKGDRVLHQGSFESRRATFQQYTTVPAEIAAKVPENLTLDEAASIPLGLATAAVGLYKATDDDTGGTGLGLLPPWTEAGHGKYVGKPFFVSGGSSSVGQFAIQLAKLSGFSPIIATASLSNTDLLKSLGATHVVDRHLLSSLSNEVANITNAPIETAFDAISLSDTQQATYNLVAPGGGLALTLPKTFEPPEGRDITVRPILGNFHLSDNRKLGVSLYSHLTALLKEGQVKPNPIEVLPNGLAGIVDGLKRLEDDKVSGLKLIARPLETV